MAIAFDDTILREYRKVLSRPMFSFKATDASDTKFLEVAAATESKILVTGNERYYPEKTREVVRMLSPRQAFDLGV